MAKKAYVVPTCPPIVRREAPELYRLEEKLNDAFEASAHELASVLGHDESDYWTTTLPEALASFLDGWDRDAVRVACEFTLAQMAEAAE